MTTNKMCNYCDVKPVAPLYKQSCLDCTYICQGCLEVTPWEDGGADDMPEHCDKCWAEAHR